MPALKKCLPPPRFHPPPFPPYHKKGLLRSEQPYAEVCVCVGGGRPPGERVLFFQKVVNSTIDGQIRWLLRGAAPPPIHLLVALASSCLTLVTERYQWSSGPLTSQFSFCALCFVLTAACE